MSLGKNIRELRVTRGMTQTQLADAIGVSYPRISELERNDGNPTLSTLQRIAEYFGVSVVDLLTDKKLQKVC